MKSLLAYLFSVLTITCGSEETAVDTLLSNRKGTIRVNPISRGVYEYTLLDKETNTTYFPVNLADSTKKQAFYYSAQYGQKPMPVIFSGVLEAGSSELNTAGANDVPQAVGKAQNVRLTAIRRE